ncbi:MAG: hypothetical protein IPM85_17025 [Chitinophagaceae bacterium]|nr:hypothetical protein [Chitinophagaceae bacterium]
MFKMNAGTWIGLAGGIIGVIVAIAAVLMTSGSSGIYITLGMLIIIGSFILLFYKLFFGPMINASRLQKNGLPGTATILEVKDTGVTINNSPQVKLILEVKNSLGQKYTTQCRVLVSRINPNAYMPGMVMAVKIDPKNEMNVIPDFSGASQATASGAASANHQINTAALTTELEQMQKDNDAIKLSGRPARAIVKSITGLACMLMVIIPTWNLNWKCCRRVPLLSVAKQRE